MSDSRAAIRKSDRKTSRLLGVTLTRDRAVVAPNKPAGSLVDALRKRFRFLPRFGRDRSAVSDATPPLPSSSPSSSEEDIVWDEPNPFGPPDPSQEWLRALIQAEIARTRRYESIGPLEDMPNDDDDYDEDEDDSDSDSGDDEDDGYDEDYDGDDDDESESENNKDNPSPIVLPHLLPIPLRFIPSTHSLHHHHPPPPSPSPSFDIAPSNEPLPWADLAQAYNDIAEAEERASRKAKRDAHRSRSKALAILGPEASSAL